MSILVSVPYPTNPSRFKAMDYYPSHSPRNDSYSSTNSSYYLHIAEFDASQHQPSPQAWEFSSEKNASFFARPTPIWQTKTSTPQSIPTEASSTETTYELSSNLRSSLKIVRDPGKTAYDVLPTGETLGSFANRNAVERYARKVESKRERARETRRKKRKAGIMYRSSKKQHS